jgi:hypothetical protein
MQEIVEFPAGGYRFIRGTVGYSLGVVALSGFRLERVRFQSLVPLEEAFQRMANIMAAAKRPAAALAACELRSPGQLTEDDFRVFNERYIGRLRRFGWAKVHGANPVSRTNVCPSVQPPSDASVYAFSYTVEDSHAPPSFVLAGAVDLMDGDKDIRELIVAPDEVDAAGIKKKARHALNDLEQRLSVLGLDWTKISGNNVYCAHDIFQAVTDEIAARGAARAGTTWHLCRPPIGGLEFEIDIRSVSVERTA